MPFRDRLDRNAALLAPYRQQQPPGAVTRPHDPTAPLTGELMPYQAPAPMHPDYGQQPPAAIVVAGQTYYAAHAMPQPMAYPLVHPAPYQHATYAPPRPPRGPDHWTRKPHLIIPAVVIAVSTTAVAAIALFYALFAIVTAAIANAFAIGVTLLGIVGVGLAGMYMATRMRHGYPSTNHTNTIQHK